MIDWANEAPDGRVTTGVADLNAVLGVTAPKPVLAAMATIPGGPVPLPPAGKAGIVVSGAVMLRARFGSRASSDLLTSGDVLASITGGGPVAMDARTLTRSGVVWVDLLELVGRHPQLVGPVLQAVGRRPTNLAMQHALGQVVSLDTRIDALLLVLADRVGVVSHDGVLLPAYLTHAHFAELLGVRRPSFTTAAARLRDREVLKRSRDGRWLIGRLDESQRAAEQLTD